MYPFWDVLGRSVPIILGGGTVQLIIFLLTRKGTMRTADALATKTDAESGSVVVGSAEKSVLLAGLIRDEAMKQNQQMRAEIEALNAKVAHLESQLSAMERASRAH